MAEEKEGKETGLEVIEEIGAEEKRKGRVRVPKRGIPIIVPIGILAVVGFVSYQFFFKKKGVEIQEAVIRTGITLPGPTLIVNLADRNVPRFLRVSVIFELDKKATADEVMKKEYIIKDTIISLVSSKTLAEVSGPEAMQLLKEEMISRINAFLENGRVINIYFTDFVVQ